MGPSSPQSPRAVPRPPQESHLPSGSERPSLNPVLRLVLPRGRFDPRGILTFGSDPPNPVGSLRGTSSAGQGLHHSYPKFGSGRTRSFTTPALSLGLGPGSTTRVGYTTRQTPTHPSPYRHCGWDPTQGEDGRGLCPKDRDTITPTLPSGVPTETRDPTLLPPMSVS